MAGLGIAEFSLELVAGDGKFILRNRVSLSEWISIAVLQSVQPKAVGSVAYSVHQHLEDRPPGPPKSGHFLLRFHGQLWTIVEIHTGYSTGDQRI